MKIVAKNRRAKFDYDLKEQLITGVVLTGPEVKSVKLGHISLKGSFVTVNNGELYLLNAHISPYKQAQAEDFEPTRSRKLLVHKKELERLATLKQNGNTLVPIAVGLEHGLIKLEIGVGRGRKRYDKRAVAQKRQADREAARAKQIHA